MFNLFNLFKKQPVIGIDISDYSIEVLQLNKSKEVLAYNRVTLEQGIVQDGKILQKEKLAEKLQEILKGIKAKKAILSLPESKIFIGDFKISPWKPEEVYTDKIGDTQIAVPKEIVKEYIEVINLAGIEPIVLDIESLSLARALLRPQRPPTNSMIIDIGARTTNVSIFNSKGILSQSITIPVAGIHFTKAIADKLKVKKEEAERLKRTFGFDDKKADNKVLPVIQADFQKIIKEIKEAIEHYENKTNNKIGEIILAGGSALIPKVDDYLAVNLERKVRVGDPLEQIKDGKLSTKKSPSILFANVIGLALRGVGRISAGINFLSSPIVSKQRIRKSRVFIISFVIITFLILGFVIYQYIYKASISGESPEGEQTPSEVKVETPGNETPTATSSEEQSPGEEKSDIIEETAKILIQDTPTGWLNVRKGPGTSYDRIGRVYPGESYPLLKEEDNWYKIKIDEETQGWVTSQYTIKE